jgi:hypothetical protein
MLSLSYKHGPFGGQKPFPHQRADVDYWLWLSYPRRGVNSLRGVGEFVEISNFPAFEFEGPIAHRAHADARGAVF